MAKLARLLKETSAATAMEYGLIVALIALAIITAVGGVANTFVDEPMSTIVSAVVANQAS